MNNEMRLRPTDSNEREYHILWLKDYIALEGAAVKKMKIKWLKKPQKHDYPAAESYLSLTFDPQVAKTFADELERAEMTTIPAKDIFRASRVSLLGISNSHVEKDRSRIIRNVKLSPLLLVRDTHHGRLIIADGYHRLCAVYSFDEDARIPCKIV